MKNKKSKSTSKSTGFFDDRGVEIMLGDILQNEYNYKVIVKGKKGDFYGKLICENEKYSPCKNIPYALNNGRGFRVIS